jgi:predicted DCC family thiol-disulfide oxidoreductase YuxK
MNARELSPTSAYGLRVFRFVFGMYLAYHCFDLVPVAGELFSAQGMIPDPGLLPTYPWFPNLLFVCDSALSAQIFVALLGVLGVALAGGFFPRMCALLLWYGLACLVTRNVFIRNPGLPYVGWMLLALTFVRPIRDLGPKEEALPRALYRGAWVLLALGYTISGLHKLGAPSWQDGSALLRLMDNPLSRPTLVGDWLRAAPPILLQVATYAALALEILFAPLSLWSRSRPWVWLAMIGMHLGIMLTVDFVDLTLGMLMMHAFTFDARWIAPRVGSGERIVFFDGVCNLCNGFVNAVLREDQRETWKFASLQGRSAAARGLSLPASDQASVVVCVGEQTFRQSDAVLELAAGLGGLWRLLSWLRIVPRPVRDALYRFIARNRYRWFGQRQQCRLPSPAERARFLD